MCAARHIVLLGACGAALFVAGAAPLAAPSARAEPAAATADKLHDVEQQMSQQQQMQDKLDAVSQTTSKNIDGLRARLIEATQGLQDKQREEETLEDKLDTLAEQIGEKSQKAKAEREKLAMILSVLAEVASRPPETLFLQSGLSADHIHRSILLRAILPQLRESAQGAARDLAALYDLKEQLAEQKRLISAAQANLEKQRQGLDQLVAARQGLLQRTEAQKAAIAAHLAELGDQAKDLRQLMQRLTPQKQKTAKPAAQKGLALKWPVAGQVRRNFGDKDADGVVSEGMAVAAPSGAPVVAPMAGRVVFAGPFRGYGLIVILSHANGFHSFLSGFGRIDADMGQDVAAGEPLGVLPLKKGEKPELYFEWRRGDDPVDPAGNLRA